MSRPTGPEPDPAVPLPAADFVEADLFAADFVDDDFLAVDFLDDLFAADFVDDDPFAADVGARLAVEPPEDPRASAAEADAAAVLEVVFVAGDRFEEAMAPVYRTDLAVLPPRLDPLGVR